MPAREELADLYGALDRHADELEQLQVLAGLDRDHVARQVAIGLAHARAGHWDLAVLTLGGALERSPNEPEIYRALGKVWLERPRDDRTFLSKAREALERVASSPSATSDTLTLYGRALLQGGDVEGAEHALQQATRRFPVDPQAFMLYASTAEKQSHLESARQALIQYSGLTSNDADFAQRAARIASLSLRLNDPDTAVALAHPGLLVEPERRPPDDVARRRPDPERRWPTAQSTIARGLEKDPNNLALRLLAPRARIDNESSDTSTSVFRAASSASSDPVASRRARRRPAPR